MAISEFLDNQIPASSVSKSSGSKAVKKQKRLLAKSKKAIVCPLMGCQDVIFPQMLLSHALKKHINHVDTRLAKINHNQVLRMHCNPLKYKLGDINTVATVLYAGKQCRAARKLPGERKFCLPNAELPDEYAKYRYHLPVTIMMARSTWFALLPDKRDESFMLQNHPKVEHIFLFWLAVPPITGKLYYTLTSFKNNYRCFQSITRQSRMWTSSQKPSEFLPDEVNYMLLRESDVLKLQEKTAGNAAMQPGFTLELVIHKRVALTYIKPLPLPHPVGLSAIKPKKKITFMLPSTLLNAELPLGNMPRPRRGANLKSGPSLLRKQLGMRPLQGRAIHDIHLWQVPTLITATN